MERATLPAEIEIAGHRCLRPDKTTVIVYLDELKATLGWSPAVGLKNVTDETVEARVRRATGRASLASLRLSCLFARVTRGPEWEAARISRPYESAVADLAKLDRPACARAMVKARARGVGLDILEPLAERYVDVAG